MQLATKWPRLPRGPFATRIEQAFEHLAECQAKIEAALRQRLKPEPNATKARRNLRAV